MEEFSTYTNDQLVIALYGCWAYDLQATFRGATLVNRIIQKAVDDHDVDQFADGYGPFSERLEAEIERRGIFIKPVTTRLL